jgi:hypothetical protein
MFRTFQAGDYNSLHLKSDVELVDQICLSKVVFFILVIKTITKPGKILCIVRVVSKCKFFKMYIILTSIEMLHVETKSMSVRFEGSVWKIL